jgi:hypothetical protein
VRTVAEAVTEMVAGGRGSKLKKKNAREGLQRGERDRRWLLVVGWWLCWLPMMKVMVGRPVMRVVVAEDHGGERKKKKKCAETGRKTGFLADFGPDFLLPQAIKSTFIYRRWKRAILYTIKKHFSH